MPSSRIEQLRQRAMEREAAAAKRAAGFQYPARAAARHAERDASRLLQLVPADTRNLTARIFGDPLPGRSALDQRKQG